MTIRILLTICILFGGIQDVQASSPVIETEELDVVDYVLPAGLALFSNLVFWVWGLTVLQAEYSEISPSSIATNFREGWEWDEDAFATNQLGHPYQGQLRDGLLKPASLFVPYAKGAVVGQIRQQASVLEEKHDENGTTFTLRAPAADLARWRSMIG